MLNSLLHTVNREALLFVNTSVQADGDPFYATQRVAWVAIFWNGTRCPNSGRNTFP